jgi:hypothetical protein
MIAVVIAGAVFGPSGGVSMTEFSPDLFARRGSTYYQWCGIQATPRRSIEYRTALEDYLHAAGHVSLANVTPPRWHFVQGSVPGVEGWMGEAKGACHAMGVSRDDRWVRWSNEHPELGSIVWPKVVAWARSEQYPQIELLLAYVDLEQAVSVEDAEGRILAAERLFAQDR